MSAKRGRGGVGGGKFRISLGLPVGAVINCADNTGAKNLFVISVKGFGSRLNRLPAACVGDMIICRFSLKIRKFVNNFFLSFSNNKEGQT
jgi:large subunit ribosomal protein L23e